MWTVPLVIVAVAVGFLVLGGLLDDRRVRIRRHHELQRDNVEAALPLLHSINDDRCIGCEACIDICPTEVLELVDHKVRVIRFTDCVQCEQCAHACPTMALVMFREGTTPRMLTVPELDENFQTGVPGQYLIGEVAGKPLVKNAANLGRAVVEHIVAELGSHPRDKSILDVVIVGSGPGGLSAGLTCLKRGLSHVVLEKEHVISSTVSRYPKGKHFMAEPSNAINVSYLPVFDASKEDLVAAWLWADVTGGDWRLAPALLSNPDQEIQREVYRAMQKKLFPQFAPHLRQLGRCLLIERRLKQLAEDREHETLQ